MRLWERIADCIHAAGDANLRAQGLTVTRLPGGRRQISHPALPGLLEARRGHAAKHGLDLVDRQLTGTYVHIPTAVSSKNTGSDHIERPAERTRIAV